MIRTARLRISGGTVRPRLSAVCMLLAEQMLDVAAMRELLSNKL